VQVGTYPEKIYEVSSEDIYPLEAKQKGIEGAVKAKVGIDETGKVIEVEIIERAGHGFDEAALSAMWKLRFKPAKTSDGRAIPFQIQYTYNFKLAPQSPK
jgi:TonB family protein